jgi:5,10-methylenetetrahydrofolate reductase
MAYEKISTITYVLKGPEETHEKFKRLIGKPILVGLIGITNYNLFERFEKRISA